MTQLDFLPIVKKKQTFWREIPWPKTSCALGTVAEGVICSSVASFVAAPLWGMVFDICGSYSPALMAMPVLLVGGIFCLIGAFRNIEA